MVYLAYNGLLVIACLPFVLNLVILSSFGDLSCRLDFDLGSFCLFLLFSLVAVLFLVVINLNYIRVLAYVFELDFVVGLWLSGKVSLICFCCILHVWKLFSLFLSEFDVLWHVDLRCVLDFDGKLAHGRVCPVRVFQIPLLFNFFFFFLV